jgi:hypothetical protein
MSGSSGAAAAVGADCVLGDDVDDWVDTAAVALDASSILDLPFFFFFFGAAAEEVGEAAAGGRVAWDCLVSSSHIFWDPKNEKYDPGPNSASNFADAFFALSMLPIL